MNKRSHKEWIKNIASLFIGLGIAFIILEIFLRIYNPFGFRVKGDQIVLPSNQKYVIENTEISGLDSTIVHTKNALGFRGPERPQDFENHLSIVATGGSTTELFYVSDGKDWPNLAGKPLDSAFKNVWMNNAGFDGFSSFGQRILLEDYLIKLHPDVVLFLMGANDVGAENLTDSDLLSTQGVSLKSFNHFLLSVSKKSEVVSLLFNLYRFYKADHTGLAHSQIVLQTFPKFQGELDEAFTLKKHRDLYLSGYRERLQNLVDLSLSSNIEPVFITQPALYGNAIDPETGVDLGKLAVSDLTGDVSWKILELYNGVMREVAEQNRILLIDVAKRLEKNSLYYYDFIHYTNLGSEKIAEIVYDDLCPFLHEKYPEHVKAECL